MNLIVRRFIAWMIDWVIILLYATVLFAVVSVLASVGFITIEPIHPFKGQFIGFLTLTLPVIIYCITMEYYKRATIGKRIAKLKVSASGFNNILLRNVLKFLPWEIAHAGILWVNYMKNVETPLWIWMLLITPQLMVVVYLVSIVFTKGQKSVYDHIAATKVTVV